MQRIEAKRERSDCVRGSAQTLPRRFGNPWSRTCTGAEAKMVLETSRLLHHQHCVLSTNQTQPRSPACIIALASCRQLIWETSTRATTSEVRSRVFPKYLAATGIANTKLAWRVTSLTLVPHCFCGRYKTIPCIQGCMMSSPPRRHTAEGLHAHVRSMSFSPKPILQESPNHMLSSSTAAKYLGPKTKCLRGPGYLQEAR